MRLEAQWEKIIRFNALELHDVRTLYDLELDIESIIDKYAKRQPRKMLLLNTLA